MTPEEWQMRYDEASEDLNDELEASPKSWMMTLMLALFTSGGHRWYLRKYAEAAAQSVLSVCIGLAYVATFAGLGGYASVTLLVLLVLVAVILQIADIITIATGSFTDGDGQLVEVPPRGEKLATTTDKLALAVPIAPCVIGCLLGFVVAVCISMFSFAVEGPTPGTNDYYTETSQGTCYDESGAWDYDYC